ncbi:hypothetical protein ACI8AF_08295 [Blastococcus sp. SYSU D00669]
MGGWAPTGPPRPEGEGKLTRTARRPDVGAAPDGPVPDGAPRGRRRLAAVGWIGLVAGLTATQLALLWRRFYYGNDDFLQFLAARDHGLSWETLSLNVFQHFGPYNRFGHLVVYRFGELSPLSGMAFMAVNYAAVLVACLWLMAELGLSARRRLVALLLIGLSVSVSESAIWLDASMHILPAIAVTLAVCAAHVRGIRTGRRRWHVAALVLFVLGQLTQERPVFALPLLVLVDVLLLWRDLPWRERFARLWALRWPIGWLVAAAAVIAVALQLLVVLDDTTSPSWATTGRTMLLALTGYVLPSLANLPLAGPPALLVQVAVVVLAVAVGAVVARVRRGNAGPVLFCAAVFLLYYGFLKASPILTADSVVENAERLHNAVYVTVPAVIALVHLRGPRLARARAGGPVGGRARRAWTALGAVLLAAYLVVTDDAYLSRQWADTTEARAYFDAVRANAAEWSDPDVTLIPLSVHPALTTAWSQSFGRQDRILDLVVRGFRFQDLGPRPVVIDDTGEVRPAVLVPVPGRTETSSGACRPGRDLQPTGVRVQTDVSRVRAPSYLVVSYRSEDDGALSIVTDPDRRRQVGFQQVHLPAGEHTRVVPLEDTDVRELVATASGSLCVEDVEVARVAVRDDGGPGCRLLDRYGRPGARVSCR